MDALTEKENFSKCSLSPIPRQAHKRKEIKVTRFERLMRAIESAWQPPTNHFRFRLKRIRNTQTAAIIRSQPMNRESAPSQTKLKVAIKATHRCYHRLMAVSKKKTDCKRVEDKITNADESIRPNEF